MSSYPDKALCFTLVVSPLWWSRDQSRVVWVARRQMPLASVFARSAAHETAQRRSNPRQL